MKKLTIVELRTEMGMSLDQFASEIGVSSKGYMSKIERGIDQPSPTVALAIERLSDGRIDAAELNPVVAASREGMEVSADEAARVVLCAQCERRTTDPAVKSCTAVDCPHGASAFDELEAA